MITMVNKVFGRLTGIKRVENDKQGLVCWLCSCSCGGTKSIRGSNLRSGSTTSCGCYQRERVSKANYKHGCNISEGTTSEYRAWASMKQRCHNPKNKAYKNYGGRGVTVCTRWLNSFPNFLKDMGEKPEGLTLDRKNNDKNYCKSNCQWATWLEQAHNKRGIVLITRDGITDNITGWGKRMGISKSTIHKTYKTVFTKLEIQRLY